MKLGMVLNINWHIRHVGVIWFTNTRYLNILTYGTKITAFMSCVANVRTVGKNKTGDARTIALRHKTHFCNRCYSGKGATNICDECVSVACPAVLHFTTISHTRNYFRNKRYWTWKVCFDFLYKFRLNISHFKKKWVRCDKKNVHRSSRKVPVFLVNF